MNQEYCTDLVKAEVDLYLLDFLADNFSVFFFLLLHEEVIFVVKLVNTVVSHVFRDQVEFFITFLGLMSEDRIVIVCIVRVELRVVKHKHAQFPVVVVDLSFLAG